MNPHIELARNAIAGYIKGRKIIDIPENLPPEFYEKRCGVFVSVHSEKELRGCVGTYMPAHKSLAEEIILNSIAACSQDHRFHPISAKELPNLSIEVSLLGAPEKISGLNDLNSKKYGVIVKCSGGRCGLLLPDLEGVDSVEKQLSIACQKGKINPTLDKDFEIFRFGVKKIVEV